MNVCGMAIHPVFFKHFTYKKDTAYIITKFKLTLVQRLVRLLVFFKILSIVVEMLTEKLAVANTKPTS